MTNRAKTNQWEKEFDEIGFGNQCRIVGARRVELKDFIRSLLSRQREELLDQVEREVIGEDEKLTIIGHKYGTDTGEIEKVVGDGEEEWKAPRNELRTEQRQKLSALTGLLVLVILFVIGWKI